MADINSLFGGGGQTLNTNGGIAGLGGGGTDADFFKAMAMRKMQQQEEDRQRKQEREDQAFAMAKQAAQNANRPPELSAQDQRMKDARERDEIMQMQARQNPAPKKMIFGPQIIPGYVQDVEKMNAYQRQAYLPGGSTMQGDINDTLNAGTHGYGDTGGFTPGGVKESRSKKAGELQEEDKDQDANTRADWYGLGRRGGK